MTTHDLTQCAAADQIRRRAAWMEESRRSVAYHEAGHAAISWFFGDQHEIEHIRVCDGDVSYFGDVETRGGVLSPVLWIDLCPPEQAKPNAIKIIMFYLAGPCAQARGDDDDAANWFENLNLLTDRSDDGGDDLSRAIFAAEALARKGFNPDTLLKRAARWTEEALSNVSVWQVVEAISARLQVTDRIEVDEACEIMETISPPANPLAYRGKWKRRFGLSTGALAYLPPAPSGLPAGTSHRRGHGRAIQFSHSKAQAS
jgi:hypothetical protein